MLLLCSNIHLVTAQLIQELPIEMRKNAGRVSPRFYLRKMANLCKWHWPDLSWDLDWGHLCGRFFVVVVAQVNACQSLSKLSNTVSKREEGRDVSVLWIRMTCRRCLHVGITMTLQRSPNTITEVWLWTTQELNPLNLELIKTYNTSLFDFYKPLFLSAFF